MKRTYEEGDLVEVLTWGYAGVIVKKRKDGRGVGLFDVKSDEDGQVIVCRRQELLPRRRPE